MKATKLIAACALAAATTGLWAQTAPWAAPQNVLQLSASGSVDVQQDLLVMTLNTVRDGADAATVQNQLKVVLDAALAEARKAARPGQVEVQTGGFSLAPRYTNKGVINGWQGTTELVVQGRDMAAISQLTGRIQGLSIARVGFSLSREARAKVEADITAEAITRFRGRAEAVSRQFGFAGYAVREVSVSTDQGGVPLPQQVMRATAMIASAPNEALPVEAGKSMVTATVGGSVQMK